MEYLLPYCNVEAYPDTLNSWLLPSGKAVSYDELRKAGLQDYYVRIIHELASRGEVTRPQVDAWLKLASSKDRHTARALRAELDALQPTPIAAPTIIAEPVRKRQQSKKTFTLVSSGDHKQVVRTAEPYGLKPTPVAPTALRPGQSADAHTVRASSGIASKLITTGQWKTEEWPNSLRSYPAFADWCITFWEVTGGSGGTDFRARKVLQVEVGLRCDTRLPDQIPGGFEIIHRDLHVAAYGRPSREQGGRQGAAAAANLEH